MRVSANSPETPTGSVTFTLRAATGGAGQAGTAGPAGWTRTIDYDGGTARVVGPAFEEAGDWVVTAEFAPGDAQFRGSRDQQAFEVIEGSDHDDNDDNDDDNSGLLPDTGGPALLWVLLGLGLVGGGGVAVVVARRRRQAVPVA